MKPRGRRFGMGGKRVVLLVAFSLIFALTGCKQPGTGGEKESEGATKSEAKAEERAARDLLVKELVEVTARVQKLKADLTSGQAVFATAKDESKAGEFAGQLKEASALEEQLAELERLMAEGELDAARTKLEVVKAKLPLFERKGAELATAKPVIPIQSEALWAKACKHAIKLIKAQAAMAIDEQLANAPVDAKEELVKAKLELDSTFGGFRKECLEGFRKADPDSANEAARCLLEAYDQKAMDKCMRNMRPAEAR